MKTPDFWRHRSLACRLLLPASWLYRLGAWADRAITRPHGATIPVISIGNVTAGGAGKTPAALALAPLVSSLGFTPHFISRGYGGKTHAAHRIGEADAWQTVGDEPLLLARTAPTWVGANRRRSINAAAQNGATLAICDDAHQHHALAKTLSFLVIDGPYGIGNGALIPAGPLREPLAAALARADAVILIGEDATGLAAHLSVPVFHATLEPACDVAPLRQQRWLAFAGTARPQKFFDTLAAQQIPVMATRSFADHHAYDEKDLTALHTEAQSLNAHLITTEKDAVKLAPAARAGITPFPVTLRFHEPDALIRFLRHALRA